MVVMDLDALDEFNTTFMEKHACECPAGSLKDVEQEKYGWELERKYWCGFCKKTYTIKTGPKQDENEKKGRGRQPRSVDKIMTAGIYTAGIPVTQVNDWATEVVDSTR